MYKRSRAEWNHKIGVFDRQKIMLIWDLNLGNISLTNDIEWVVEDIGEIEQINPTEYIIVYRDSEGGWNGWDATIREFYFFPMPEKVKNDLQEQLNINFDTI